MSETDAGSDAATDASAEALRPSTLDVIAREADVSVATASRVLNGRPGISDATRERVIAAMRRHGYRRRGVEQEAAARFDSAGG